MKIINNNKNIKLINLTNDNPILQRHLLQHQTLLTRRRKAQRNPRMTLISNVQILELKMKISIANNAQSSEISPALNTLTIFNFYLILCK
jgi:hypothetical protein